MIKNVVVMAVLVCVAGLLAASSANKSMSRPILGTGFVISARENAHAFADIASLRGSVVKWEMLAFESGRDRPQHAIAADLDYLESVLVPAAARHDVGIILELHETFGGKAGSGSSGRHRFITSDAEYQKLIDFWIDVSRRFRDHPEVVAYDILAEPWATVDQWRPKARDIIRAIRDDGDTKPIIVEMPFGNPDKFKRFRAINRLGDVRYAFHYYEPHRFTHHAVGTYPSATRTIRTKNGIRDRLREVRRFKSANPGTDVLVAGFSATNDAVSRGANKYVRDCADVFNELGLSWTYHHWTDPRYSSSSIWWLNDARRARLRERMR